ncbi:MAG: helix-turn-helix domain-containing protein [Devosia sp.]
MHLPLAQFFRLQVAAELTAQLSHGATIKLSGLNATDAANFERWSDFMRSGDAARSSHAVEELLLRLDRIRFENFTVEEAKPPASARGSEVDGHQSRLVWQLCSYVCDNFRENIDLVDVAAAAAMHPKSAMRAFKKSTGMTLHKYLSLLRLSYAQALLMNDDLSVIDVAMESGFGSLGAFNTSFSKLAGKSPSQFRRDTRDWPGRILPLGRSN